MSHFLGCWAEEVAGEGCAMGLGTTKRGEVYLVARAAHDGREDGAGRVVAREAGLAHAGAVVDHERSNIIIHGELWGQPGGKPRCRRV